MISINLEDLYMRRFFLLRSNIKALEKYHDFKDLESFKQGCWDYYLLMALNFIQRDMYDECIIWRLTDTPIEDIVFKVRKKLFIQRWVKSFNEIEKYEPATDTLFRGGFEEYDRAVQHCPDVFGKKLYLSAGKRIQPQFGGKYDKILVEDDKFLFIPNSVPFFKTCNLDIFKPLKNIQKKYDICWICNGSQWRYKGQDYFIEQIGKSDYLKSLSIVHIGNKPEEFIKTCQKFGVSNIEFKNHIPRPEINKVLNESKYGIVASNDADGCPRVSTEVLCSGTPLLLRSSTSLLAYYKMHLPVIVFKDDELEEKVEVAMGDYKNIVYGIKDKIERYLSTDQISRMNYDIWKKEKDSKVTYGGGETPPI